MGNRADQVDGSGSQQTCRDAASQFSAQSWVSGHLLPLKFRPSTSVVEPGGYNLDIVSPQEIPDVELKTITRFLR